MKANSLPMKRLAAATLAALAPLAAWPAAGEFTFVVGEVALTKANGQRSVPTRGTPVDPGDRITTGANGMAQLTMVDQARLSLRPQTQFVIEAYGDRPDSAVAVAEALAAIERDLARPVAAANPLAEGNGKSPAPSPPIPAGHVRYSERRSSLARATTVGLFAALALLTFYLAFTFLVNRW